jgi:tetraacyldisaccharide 4'-kinase
VPVISIGNLTLGGTGKTPCVEYVAQYLSESGRMTVILSRGYGVESGQNDEALCLEENLPDVPHLQGRDRAELARVASEELEAEVLVLDDGFQHRRLHRDLDIVLLDATQPIMDEYLFPRGMRREPLSALARATSFILTRVDQSSAESLQRQKDWLATQFPMKPVSMACHQPRAMIHDDQELDLAAFARQKAIAFAGLAQPEAFAESLKQLGIELEGWRTFPDHHGYTREDVESLISWADQFPPGTWVLTTQKDWVKLRVHQLGSQSLAYLKIQFAFREGEEQFRELLERVCPAREDDDKAAEPDERGEG